jgi:hypothetical protein
MLHSANPHLLDISLMFLFSAKLLDLETKPPSLLPRSCYYRCHLLQFGNMNVPTEEAGDITDEATMDVLARIVCHFVAFLSSDSCAFFESMENGVLIPRYVCHSDLAFAVLVLEQHIMKWRHLIHWELETGRPVPAEYSREAKGLLYNDGIAGEEGKRRFDDLNV